MTRQTVRLTDVAAFETTRLHVRPLGPTDAPALQKLTDEPSVTENVHFLPSPFTLADATALIAGDGSGNDLFWGVTRRDEPGLIGAVGTHLRPPDGIEIGYWFAAAVRGQGLALEAVDATAATLEARFPTRRLFAECRRENIASWRLLTRSGFTTDGTRGQRPNRLRLVRKPSGDR